MNVDEKNNDRQGRGFHAHGTKFLLASWERFRRIGFWVGGLRREDPGAGVVVVVVVPALGSVVRGPPLTQRQRRG